MTEPADALADELRTAMARVDALDLQLADLLAARFASSRQIGRIKAQLSAARTDPARIEGQIRRFADDCASRGLDRAWAEALIGLVIRQVVAERSDPRYE